MLDKKVVIITGASSGIGAEMAVLLSKSGAIPVLMARSLSKLNEVAKRIEGEHAIFQLDVTSPEGIKVVMEQVLTKYGKIDILINNAGFAVFDSFEAAKLEDFEEMMNVNYMGLVRCTKAVLPAMLKQDSGHIINIASIAGKVGVAKSSGYAATKHAVLGFTNSLRQELMGTSHIIVSAINPGPIRTSFFDKADRTGNYLNNLPQWIILQAEQVAKAVLKVIQQKKVEKDMPRIAGWGAKLLQMMPRSWDSLTSKLTNKK